MTAQQPTSPVWQSGKEGEMVRHYSTRDFFRYTPNRLPARYFEAHGVLAELDFAAMKETRIDELFAAWLELPEGQRNEMDADSIEIHALRREKGGARSGTKLNGSSGKSRMRSRPCQKK